MAVLITWAPNTESDISGYELERSDDGLTFTLLTTITHDLGDSLVYNSAEGVFFYEDSTGVANTHFYRLRAFDTALNYSPYTTPRQVGPPDPPLCVVFGVVVDANGEPNTNVAVKARIVSTKTTKDGQVVDSYGVTSEQIEAFTDDNGFFEIPLLQNANIILSIPSIELEREVCIPAQDTIEFQDLL